jgi:hypothetical protein
MATNNIFVYNAGDRENQMLAALVRFCDQAERKFSFLSVTSAESVARMHKFLSQHGITPDSVRLPFVIVVGPHGRTVMHGDPIHHWLGGLVAALVTERHDVTRTGAGTRGGQLPGALHDEPRRVRRGRACGVSTRRLGPGAAGGATPPPRRRRRTRPLQGRRRST